MRATGLLLMRYCVRRAMWMLGGCECRIGHEKTEVIAAQAAASIAYTKVPDAARGFRPQKKSLLEKDRSISLVRLSHSRGAVEAANDQPT